MSAKHSRKDLFLQMVYKRYYRNCAANIHQTLHFSAESRTHLKPV